MDRYSESLQVNIPELPSSSSSSILAAERTLSEAISLTQEQER
ncbi:MAG: hypothetical protein BAJATHORv1_40212 [Candidatus Thorarchaeota archaeon]|nr:MAG: hypothetical protein BAJATHORv1_40212 [Candidatus Thorarchaeota archaeon]